MEKMSLEELVSLERIETQHHHNLQETYSVLDLKLSKLFKEILKELKKGILSKLAMYILLYSLHRVPFNIVKSTVSGHILFLEDAGFIVQEKDGKFKRISIRI